MSVFLDVGAHEGQTLDEVTTDRHDFDRIIAFEPMPRQFAALRERFHRDPRVELCNFGLADRTAMRTVYGNNDQMEASIYPTKVDVDETVVTTCPFVRASNWLTQLHRQGPHDLVVMKLNCEGGEIPILMDLLDTGTIAFVDHLMVDFDCRKITGLETAEIEVTERLQAAGVNFALSEDVMVGETHQDRIRAWLQGLGL